MKAKQTGKLYRVTSSTAPSISTEGILIYWSREDTGVEGAILRTPPAACSHFGRAPSWLHQGEEYHTGAERVTHTRQTDGRNRRTVEPRDAARSSHLTRATVITTATAARGAFPTLASRSCLFPPSAEANGLTRRPSPAGLRTAPAGCSAAGGGAGAWLFQAVAVSVTSSPYGAASVVQVREGGRVGRVVLGASEKSWGEVRRGSSGAVAC